MMSRYTAAVLFLALTSALQAQVTLEPVGVDQSARDAAENQQLEGLDAGAFQFLDAAGATGSARPATTSNVNIGTGIDTGQSRIDEYASRIRPQRAVSNSLGISRLSGPGCALPISRQTLFASRRRPEFRPAPVGDIE